MEQFVIQGGYPLEGKVTPSGNKNAALPLLAACFLTEEPVRLHNVPDIQDVNAMRALLESMGVKIKKIGDHSIEVNAAHVHLADFDPDLCKRIRASILLAGPALARCGELRLPPPGGDVIGRRRVDTHILALRGLGAQAEYDRANHVFHFRSDKLKGNVILLDEASVTATENTIMAAVTAEGETILRNAASEPHIQELCQFLNILGAQIENIGSNTLHIQGVQKLHKGEFTIGPDYLEVAAVLNQQGTGIYQQFTPKMEGVIRKVAKMFLSIWYEDGFSAWQALCFYRLLDIYLSACYGSGLGDSSASLFFRWQYEQSPAGRLGIPWLD